MYIRTVCIFEVTFGCCITPMEAPAESGPQRRTTPKCVHWCGQTRRSVQARALSAEAQSHHQVDPHQDERGAEWNEEEEVMH
jgi:hypothetical protein